MTPSYSDDEHSTKWKRLMELEEIKDIETMLRSLLALAAFLRCEAMTVAGVVTPSVCPHTLERWHRFR